MNRKVFLIAGAFAVLGTGLLAVYLRRLEESVRGGPATQVLVLLKDSAPGTTLTRELLGTRELPRSYLESRHVPARALDQVLGLSLALAAQANEALLWTDLHGVRPRERRLSSLVPVGRRALTLEDASARDGLLSPGDTVDVLVVAEGRDSGDGVRLVVQNVLVLAVDGELGGPERGAEHERNGRERNGHGRVTLSVSISEAKALAHVEQRGRLRLITRNAEDVTVNEEPPVTPAKGDS